MWVCVGVGLRGCVDVVVGRCGCGWGVCVGGCGFCVGVGRYGWVWVCVVVGGYGWVWVGVGVSATGIEPGSPAYQANKLTITPRVLKTKSVKKLTAPPAGTVGGGQTDGRTVTTKLYSSHNFQMSETKKTAAIDVM